jgi:hypothetical protein
MPAQSSAHVERNSVLDTVRHSCSWGSPTGRFGKCGDASAVGRFQARREASKVEPLVSTVLDWADGDLERLEIRSCDRAAGDGDRVAAHTFQAILVEVVSAKGARSTTREFGDSEAGKKHGNR